MNYKHAFLLVSAILAVSAICIPQQLQPVATGNTTDPRRSEIGQDQYAVLADPDTFPTERLDDVRRLLVDDGKITLREFRALGLPLETGLNSKRRLLERLEPDPVEGIFLHAGEPMDLTGFSAAVCVLKPPRTQTDPIEIRGQTYQLRRFHFCGSKRISGFSVYRNDEEINSVRHFGHGSAEVFLSGDNPCYFRKDLSSAKAYRLLQGFYDGQLTGRDFFFAIIEPSLLQ